MSGQILCFNEKRTTPNTRTSRLVDREDIDLWMICFWNSIYNFKFHVTLVFNVKIFVLDFKINTFRFFEFQNILCCF